MKKILTIITVMCAAAFIFSGCEDNDHFIPAGQTSVFYLNTAGLSMKEKDMVYTFTITWSKFQNQAGSIDIKVTPTGDNPAIEGENYIVSAKNFTFGETEYTKTFTITTIFDPATTPNKTFELELVNMNATNAKIGAFGAPSVAKLIVLNEHPFDAVLGPVTQTWIDYFSDGEMNFASEIEPDNDDIYVLYMGLNLINGKDPNKAEIRAEETADEFILHFDLPYNSGWSASGTPVEYVGCFYLPEEDDIDVAVDATNAGIPFTITAVSPKEEPLFRFENGVPAAHRIGTMSFYALPLPPPLADYLIKIN